MEKRKDRPADHGRRGLMESLLRRRDPGGDDPFDPDNEEEDEESSY